MTKMLNLGKNLRSDRPKISVIVPVFNEEKSVEHFVKIISPILKSCSKDYELLFVNDGSRDNTLEVILELQANDKHIVVVDFSRNFGKEAALTAGIDYARYDVVIPIDVDLQDPPDLIPEMVTKWQEGYNIVLAKRKTRNHDTFLKRSTASLFYWLINKLTDFHIPENVGDYRLIDRRIVDIIKTLPEKTKIFKCLFAWIGFEKETTTIEFERKARYKGKTSFNYFSLFKIAMDGIVSFSMAPLRMWLFVTMSLLVILILLFLTGALAYLHQTLLLIILILEFFAIAICCEYLSRIYNEVKSRPLYIINKIYYG